MSVKRKDLVRYFEKNGFYMLRERVPHDSLKMNRSDFIVKRIRQDRQNAHDIFPVSGRNHETSIGLWPTYRY